MVSTQDSGSGNAVIPSTGGVATQKPERQTSETRGHGDTETAETGCVDQLLTGGAEETRARGASPVLTASSLGTL